MEQEVTGDETSALQSVLESDERRERLLRKEHALIAHPDPGSVVRCDVVSDCCDVVSDCCDVVSDIVI